MGLTIGIIFIIIAILGWGFGDFFIQKITRKYGNWKTLFAIALFGSIALFPFIYKDIPNLFKFDTGFWILFFASIILFIAALLEFESLKKGKLDVIEPIWAIEIPMSALLAFVVINESISPYQLGLIALLIIGLVLTSVKSFKFSGRLLLEKGAMIAVGAALLMGAANFLVGLGARVSDALMVNWFFNFVITIGCLIFLIKRGDLRTIFSDIKKSKGWWFGMCVLDNSAWVAFAFAMSIIPIAITVALSDAYIIIAVLLGMFVNKEKLKKSQKMGLVLAIISALVLGFTLG